MTRTYLLGAGFSKAFHPSMPLMSDLASSIPERLGLATLDLAPFGKDVERWLSFLAEPQPWLSESENLENQSLFLRASDAVAEEIRLASQAKPDGVSEHLLDRFVLEAKVSNSSIITFNYDLLVEDVFSRWRTKDAGSYLYPLPLVERQAAGHGRFVSQGPPAGPIAQLLKLHGSLNWKHSMDAVQGPATLTAEGLRTGSDPGEFRAHLYEDLRTLVMPPASSKSRFYGGAAMRALWRNAFRLLQNTDELVIVGYSLPKTDLQVATLLSTSVRPGTTVSIVDVSAGPSERAREVLPTHEIVDHTSPDAAHAYVRNNCGPIVTFREMIHAEQREQWMISDETRSNAWLPAMTPPGTDDLPLIDRITRAWPTAVTMPIATDPGGQVGRQWQVYVPLGEWKANPNPFA